MGANEYITRMKMVAVVPVPTPGTSVQLSASARLATSYYIEAKRGNSDIIYLADTSANAATGTLAHTLEPGERFSLVGDNKKGENYSIDLSDYFIDAVSAGDGVIISEIVRRSVV